MSHQHVTASEAKNLLHDGKEILPVILSAGKHREAK